MVKKDIPPEYHIPQSPYHNKVAYLGIEFFCAPILTTHPTVVVYYSNLNRLRAGSALFFPSAFCSAKDQSQGCVGARQVFYQCNIIDLDVFRVIFLPCCSEYI